MVVGAVDTHDRPAAAALAGALPAVGPGVDEVFDVNAMIRLHPQLALVDDAARDGGWKDVDAPLPAGIDVMSTVGVAETGVDG